MKIRFLQPAETNVRLSMKPPLAALHSGRIISNRSPVLQYQFGTDIRPIG